MKNHIVSKELAQKLRAVGAKQVSSFYWIEFEDGTLWLSRNNEVASITSEMEFSAYSAFLSTELLEELPRLIENEQLVLFLTKADDHYTSGYMTKSGYLEVKERGTTASESLGNLYLYLAENGLLKNQTL